MKVDDVVERTRRAEERFRCKGGIPQEKREKLLELISENPGINRAIHAVRISSKLFYETIENDLEFAKAFYDARERSITAAEDEAWRRGIEGVEEPVFHRGEVVGNVRKYSDLLLIFMLKAARPDVYRERYELSGSKGGPITISAVELTDDQLAQIASRAPKELQPKTEGELIALAGDIEKGQDAELVAQGEGKETSE